MKSQGTESRPGVCTVRQPMFRSKGYTSLAYLRSGCSHRSSFSRHPRRGPSSQLTKDTDLWMKRDLVVLTIRLLSESRKRPYPVRIHEVLVLWRLYDVVELDFWNYRLLTPCRFRFHRLVSLSTWHLGMSAEKRDAEFKGYHSC